MEAHFTFWPDRVRRAFFLSGLIVLLLFATGLFATEAQYETANFKILNAPSAAWAEKLGQTVEQYRRELAVLWLGHELPDWSEKCPIVVHIGVHLGAGGQTSFVFQGDEVFGWEMEIQGSSERILDSVLPHEITHMILASHFRKPIPRWLDEGAATFVEHDSEKENYRNLIRHYLKPNVSLCIPFRRMVALKEYPADAMPFYSQGFSVVEYLIALGGQQALVRFAESGMRTNSWDDALQTHYGFKNLGDLQENYWITWVVAGSPMNLPATLRPNAAQDSIAAEELEMPMPLSPALLASLLPKRTTPTSETLPSIELVSAKPSQHYAQILEPEIAREPFTRNDTARPKRESPSREILIDASTYGPVLR